MSELDEAEALAGQLISALSAREQTPALVADVAVQRQRNCTLFANAYDQVRRAISYLQWDDDDLEKVAPSLYGGRIVKRKGDAPPSTEPPESPVAGTGTPGSAHPVSTSGAASMATPPLAPTGVGLPGGHPFLDGN